MDLFSRLRNYLQSQLLSSPHHFNCVFLTRFHFSERIRVVVNIFNFTRSDLDDPISGFESGLCGGRIIADAVEQQSGSAVGVVWDRAEIHAETARTRLRVTLRGREA